LPLVLGAGAQHEVDHLVAEVLRVADAGGLLDLLQLVVEGGAVEDLAGVRVAVFLVLDPEVGVGHVAVEDVLAVLAVALEVGGLDLLADELGVARGEELLDEGQVAASVSGGILLCLDLLLEHIHEVHRVGGDLAVVEVEHLGQHLEGEAGGQPVMPSSTPA
jgi:hypothetical protein